MVRRTMRKIPVDPQEAARINAGVLKFRENSLTIRTAIKYGAYALIGYFFFDFFKVAIKELAGKETVANISIDFISKIGLGIFGAGGCGWALKERSLRKKETKRFSTSYSDLKKTVDKNAGTSKLDEYGETNKEDVA